MGQCKWSLKKITMLACIIIRVLKTLPSTCILNYSKVVDWSHLNPRGAWLKSLVFYVTPHRLSLNYTVEISLMLVENHTSFHNIDH